MKFNVAAEMKQPGRAGSYEALETCPTQSYLGRQIEFASPLAVRAAYVYDGEGFTVKGEAQVTLCSECARCGKSFEEPFGFAFEERFVKNPGPDDECYPMGSEELDIAKMVFDNLFLNLPLHSVCSEDCKGLCPVCGCDLNLVQCACVGAEDKAINPFAKLETLLYHDKEV
ncbi:MAG: DUF177 domain-containing protein [Christensenellaceae bacterium]|jgi:uncharacterized protein|nr:DUF177 domain-containing protein [Christensenellaceae bacterium]